MTEPEPDRNTEHERLLSWRRQVLVRAGFAELYVEILATALDADLHRLVELKERGCRDELVARICL